MRPENRRIFLRVMKECREGRHYGWLASEQETRWSAKEHESLLWVTGHDNNNPMDDRHSAKMMIGVANDRQWVEYGQVSNGTR